MEQDLTKLSDHVAVLRRRWRWLAGCTLAGIVVALTLSFLQTPVYTSSATLLLDNRTATNDPGVAMDREEVATQAEVVHSEAVARRVVRELDLDLEVDELLDSVVVEAVDDKRVIAISATLPDAEDAANVANSFAEEYIALRIERAAEAELAVREVYLERISEVDVELDEVREQLAGNLSANRRAVLEAQERSLIARQAQMQAALATSGDPMAATVGGELLQGAEPATSPSSPRPLRAGLLGAVLGLLLGTLLAYLRDRTDDVVRDEQRVEAILGGAPILGRIPTEPDEYRGRVAALLGPHSPTSEAYRALSTNVRFLLAASRSRDTGPTALPGGIVMVTSGNPAEGKTSVASNLAVAASRVGMSVVLVDADLRNPGVIGRFGLDVPQGLSDVLIDDRPVEWHLVDVGVENLRLLPAGSIPPNPAELLASPRARVVWRELRQLADLVIVDTAPVLRVADTLELTADVDELIVVARHGQTRLHGITAVQQRIAQVGGRVSGLVLNDVATAALSYGYGYGRVPERVDH